MCFFETKYIFSYTFDLCGRVSHKKIFTRPISRNKTNCFFLFGLIEKIPDPRNAKEHYQSFHLLIITKKIKNNYSATKDFWKSKHWTPKPKLPKILRQVVKHSQVCSGKSSNSPFHSETKKSENLLNGRNTILKVMQVFIIMKFNFLLTLN